MNESHETSPRLPGARSIHMVGAGLALAMLGGASLLTVRPLLASRAVAQEQAAVMTDARDRSDAARAQLGVVRERAARLKRELASNQVVLQPAAALNEQLGALTAAAQRSGLRVQQVSPGKANAGSRFTTVPLRVTGSGTYPAVALFLSTLHKQEPTTGVVGIALRDEADAQRPVSTAEGAAQGATFTLDLLWHALPAKAASAAGAGRAGSAAPAGGEVANTPERP